MRTIGLGEAKDKLSSLVDEAVSTHEIITITKHGHPAAVLMSADDLESLHETLHWLSKPDIVEEVRTAERRYLSGESTSGEDLRAEFGLPAR